MHKISNFGRMTPAAFGISRFHGDVSNQPQPSRRPPTSNNVNGPGQSEYSVVNLSFNVPFSSSLAGPEREDVLHSSPGALQRWTFPPGTPEDTPTHKLPVHVQNQDALRRLCGSINEKVHPQVEAVATVIEPQTGAGMNSKSPALVTNVCISGDRETVHTVRARVLNQTPIMMVSCRS